MKKVSFLSSTYRLKTITAIMATTIFVLSAMGIVLRKQKQREVVGPKNIKLYWFIPDGLRAEPDTFNIYKWAQEGKLPNIKKMMQRGSYGYSIPVFPGHTPSNFATLFTGVLPREHGVADGPIRPFGYPLSLIAKSGFSSTAKEKNPIWFTLERQGISSTLLSVPGSTPPEISLGNIVKGRWGGWGVEFPSVVFHSAMDRDFKKNIGLNDRAFNVGKKLTLFTKPQSPQGWSMSLPKSYSPIFEISLENWGAPLFALLVDDLDDDIQSYSKIILSKDKKSILGEVKRGEWSAWWPIELTYPIQKSHQDQHPQKSAWEQAITDLKVPTFVRISPIKIDDVKHLRIRVIYDALNSSIAYPMQLSDDLHGELGPMVDYPDDFPPQLIYFPEDKKTFISESLLSFEWHQKAVEYFLNKKDKDILIHNIYTPNQMLTSRWWMGSVDPQSVKYGRATDEEHILAMEEILNMYKRIDDVLGVALQKLDKDAYLVFSSDHGIAPLNHEVRLNNLFAKKGWLKFIYDSSEGVFRIDWAQTKVVFLQSNHIYVNPNGLGGVVGAQTGRDYELLVSEVQNSLQDLRGDTGDAPFEHIYRRAEAPEKLGLPAERVGDLVLVHRLGYCAVEDLSEDLSLFFSPIKSGYKQGLNPQENKSLWTPFMIVGPGIRPGYSLEKPISHLDQYPIVMKVLKADGGKSLSSETAKKIFN